MSLQTSSMTVIQDCMDVKKNEEVLIVVDEKSLKIGQGIFEACMLVEAEPIMVLMSERETHGAEPPNTVAEAMKQANVVIAPTTKSLSHTEARREATKAGARIATMPGITEEMMERTLRGDYQAISELSKKIADILTEGREAVITSPGGTNVRLKLEGRNGHADTGIIHEKGGFGNLPAGEAYIAPIEGSAEGTVVFDGAVAGITELDTPITVTIAKGEAIEITGGKAAKSLKKIIENAGDNGRNVAELGIGTNDKARISSELLEVEKVLGTVHIALGDSKSMGGTIQAPIHIDGVIKEPTLAVDGKTVIENGKILI